MPSLFFKVMAFVALLPSLGSAQNVLPVYQTVAQRQVCAASPVLDRPDGLQIGQAAAGELIAVNDVSFSADGTLFFQFGEEEGPRFISSENVAHFCGFGQRNAAAPIAFLAPPNTCHLVAASRRTLEEVNLFVIDYPGNAAVMNVFRARNGWYAISLGLVSTAAAELVLTQGQDIPDDAYCSDGANYFDVMAWRDGKFLELTPPPPADVAARLDEARDLGFNLTDENRVDRLQRACLLGSGWACGTYANTLTDSGDAILQEETRFNLLGCMLGEAIACNNVLFNGGMQNRTVFAAFPDRTGADAAPPMLDPELAKVGCDAGLAPSCWALAKPAIEYRSEAIPDYLTSTQATLSACVTAQGWYCREFEMRMSDRYSVMNTGWSPTSLFGVAQTFAAICQPPGPVDPDICTPIYGRYSGFIRSGAGNEDQRLTSALAIRNGCDADNLTACAYQSGLADYFQLIDRRLAAAKVLAACDASDDQPRNCDFLIKQLGTDLPEAQGPIREEYDARAQLCRTTEGTDGSNPCRDALLYYGNNISTDDIAEPLALLQDTCGIGDKITGCEPLYRYYEGEELSFTDSGVRKSWPAEPQKALDAMKAGCVATLEGVPICGSLGLTYEQQGDFAAATQAYTLGCETGMTAKADQYYGQERVCYWAAKHARNNMQDFKNARRWFGYDCHAQDDPFSCKFLGLMYAQAEGGMADLLTAMNLYHTACYLTDDITVGDGQACYFYAQSLVAQRAGVTYDDAAGDYRADRADSMTDAVVMENLAAASKAYFRGCVDDRVDSCTAHKTLLEDWAKGAYPRANFECRLMDAAGQMAPAKRCLQFSHYLSVPGPDDYEGWVDVFVWPDGDRTVTFDDFGAPNLNGAGADWVFPDGGWDCMRNRTTGRSFCYAPA